MKRFIRQSTNIMDWCTVIAVISLFIAAGSINGESITNNDNGSTKHHEQNRFVKLICRDDTTLVVGIENEFGETQMIGEMGETYMVIINNRDESKLPPKTVYLIKKPIAVVKNLIPLTSYNISADLMKGDFQYTAKKLFIEFETLGENYVPGNVTNIYTNEFSLSADGNGVDVTVSWDPNEDRTCAYKLFFHTRDYNPENEIFSVREFNQNLPDELYRHELKQLEFGTEYAVGVQALNDKNETIKSEIWWHTVTTPSCLDLYKGNATLCSPYHPENITVVVESTTANHYNFNVTWELPTIFPNYYTLDIIDYESGLRQFFNVSNGTTNSVQLNDVEVNGLNFEVFVTAHSTGGQSSGFYHGKIDPAIIYRPVNTNYSTIAIVAGSMFAVTVILVLLLVKLKLCRHAKSIREQIKLDMKWANDSTIYESQYPTKEQLDQICALQSDFNFDDDPMELDPSLVQTLEIIGEGAFGCVRRATLLPDKHVVAVKMLKSFPSYADVRNFYREIEVMKSVPKHPNIVGIVGHCTKNVFGLMLLTEYCSEGNLLNFLRNIYDDQLWEQDRVQTLESLHGDSLQPKKQFTDELRKDSAYASTSSSRISIAENHGYDFDPSTPRMCIVENHGYGFDIGNNQVEKAITEVDLLSFAYQVANGMDFLSKKKVVHRDLACRNVLVLADRTAKISDFGLSRDIYQENLYKKSGAGLLPIKWLALESMTHQVYSTQSDVWSFGVLLYEIVTKGAVPYPTVDTKDILNFLKDGRRMERPNSCRADIYMLMLNCWNAVPTERPTFKMIKDELVRITREINVSG